MCLEVGAYQLAPEPLAWMLAASSRTTCSALLPPLAVATLGWIESTVSSSRRVSCVCLCVNVSMNVWGGCEEDISSK